MALSVTPKYLKNLGLLNITLDAKDTAQSKKVLLNQQMKVALSKLAFLPFGLLVDKWRWQVFSGKVTDQEYNKAWWDLRYVSALCSALIMNSN